MKPEFKKSFWALMITQFFGAFNDNVFKVLITLLIIQWVVDVRWQQQLVALTSVVFAAPFLLFSMFAGRVAGRHGKPRVIVWTTWLECGVCVVGVLSLLSKNIPFMLGTLFVQALQSAFFSPAKYGILPEWMSEGEISKANGWLNVGTFAAILLGTFVASQTVSSLPLASAIMLTSSALGLAAAYRVAPLPAVKPEEPLLWNPFPDLWANWKLIAQDRSLRLACVSVNGFWFFGALFQLNILLYANQMMQASSQTAGLLLVPVILGIGLGSFLAGLVSKDRIELGWVTFGAIGVCLFSSDLIVAYRSTGRLIADLFLLGFSSGFYEIPLLALIQWRAPRAERGRVLATVNFLSFLAILAASGVLWILNTGLDLNPAQVFFALGLCALAGTVILNSVFDEVRERFAALIRLKPNTH